MVGQLVAISALFAGALAGTHEFKFECLQGSCDSTTCSDKTDITEFTTCYHDKAAADNFYYATVDNYSGSTKDELCAISDPIVANERFTISPKMPTTWTANKFALTADGTPEKAALSDCISTLKFTTYTLVDSSKEADFKKAVCDDKTVPAETVATAVEWKSSGSDEVVFLVPHVGNYITVKGDDTKCKGITYSAFRMTFSDSNIMGGDGAPLLVGVSFAVGLVALL
jgi:hypothetical protein